MKWTVCIEGYGEGCDYTIDCNKKFYSYESDATTPEEFAKDLHEHLGDDDGRIYMYDCCERGYGERTFGSVSVAPAELVDISDLLMDSIKKDIEEDEARQREINKIAKEKTEKVLYEKLHKKYGNDK